MFKAHLGKAKELVLMTLGLGQLKGWLLLCKISGVEEGMLRGMGRFKKTAKVSDGVLQPL